MRAVMRSTSLQPLSRARKLCWAPARSCVMASSRPRKVFCKPLRNCVIASSRAAAWARSRRGLSSQFFSARLPMPVVQVSNSENSVGESSPRRVCVSSRLRRVVGGSSISSSGRTTCRFCTWGKARPCVCSA